MDAPVDCKRWVKHNMAEVDKESERNVTLRGSVEDELEHVCPSFEGSLDAQLHASESYDQVDLLEVDA